MGFPAQLDQNDLRFPDDDTVGHFALRELQIVLRVCAVLAIVATAVMMVTFYFWAWVPLLVLVGCYVALGFINRAEHGTRVERYESEAARHRVEAAHELHPEADNTIEAQFLAQDDEHFTSPELFRREGLIGAEIIVGLALAALALTIAGIVQGLIPWTLAAIAFGLIMTYGGFVMAPIWLGWISDVEDVERGRPSNEHRDTPAEPA